MTVYPITDSAKKLYNKFKNLDSIKINKEICMKEQIDKQNVDNSFNKTLKNFIELHKVLDDGCWINCHGISKELLQEIFMSLDSIDLLNYKNEHIVQPIPLYLFMKQKLRYPVNVDITSLYKMILEYVETFKIDNHTNELSWLNKIPNYHKNIFASMLLIYFIVRFIDKLIITNSNIHTGESFKSMVIDQNIYVITSILTSRCSYGDRLYFGMPPSDKYIITDSERRQVVIHVFEKMLYTYNERYSDEVDFTEEYLNKLFEKYIKNYSNDWDISTTLYMSGITSQKIGINIREFDDDISIINMSNISPIHTSDKEILGHETRCVLYQITHSDYAIGFHELMTYTGYDYIKLCRQLNILFFNRLIDIFDDNNKYYYKINN